MPRPVACSRAWGGGGPSCPDAAAPSGCISQAPQFFQHMGTWQPAGKAPQLHSVAARPPPTPAPTSPARPRSRLRGWENFLSACPWAPHSPPRAPLAGCSHHSFHAPPCHPPGSPRHHPCQLQPRSPLSRGARGTHMSDLAGWYGWLRQRMECPQAWPISPHPFPQPCQEEPQAGEAAAEAPVSCRCPGVRRCSLPSSQG